jgi:hypothetical protein
VPIELFCILGDKPPDQAKENAGILALQAQETMVDHCVRSILRSHKTIHCLKYGVNICEFALILVVVDYHSVAKQCSFTIQEIQITSNETFFK